MSDAEALLDLADAVLHPRGELIECDAETRWAADVAALAMRLRARPAVAFRAQVEGWPRERIVRELY